MSERVILAYSGGLDTSVAISWIGKETGREVVAVAIDLGQGGEDMDVVRQRALDCGAVEAVVVDARDEFAEQYCLPTIKSNALYMDRYPLVSAINVPLLLKQPSAVASEHGAGGRDRRLGVGGSEGRAREQRQEGEQDPRQTAHAPSLRAGAGRVSRTRAPSDRRTPTPSWSGQSFSHQARDGKFSIDRWPSTGKWPGSRSLTSRVPSAV